MNHDSARTLALREVHAGYHGTTVVDRVSTEVTAGGWLSLVGPNGAGKSTLLKAIAGLVPSGGEIRIHGEPTNSLSRKQKARVLGYSPQDPIIPGGLTVTDYVLLGRTPHLGLLARESANDLSIVEDVLARLDLAPLAARKMRTLSGGERQRAVLARVLAGHTKILLLDEPTTGLDIGHAQALLELVDKLRREDGTTVVSTLHDLTFAAQYADQILLLNEGTVAACGPPETVLTSELVSTHYSAHVKVLSDAGNVVVTPVRSSSADTTD